MKRKYDLRNKRNFVIILILSVFIIGIFSLFIYKYTHASKIEYKVSTGSVLQSVNKDFINTVDEAVLKTRWDDSYNLLYQDKKINLGKRVIVYDSVTGSIKLYGKFYGIDEKGKVVEENDETILANTTDTKFYKLDDREYLLVDRQIVNEDRSINASNYLLVELDRMGNAKLSNDKLNLKTIAPTKLITSKYVFDIANEKLQYGKKDIDLKKIIGSTNEYKEEKKEEKENGGNGAGVGNAVNVNNITNNTNATGTAAGVVNGNDNQGEVTDIDEIKDKVKMTSIVRVQEGLTQADIDYVVYDPYNEYKSVYAEIERPGKVDVVYLSKTDTHMVINDLMPSSEYKVNFIYTTADSEGVIKTNKFEEVTLKTLTPVYTGYISRFSSYRHKLTYTVNLQSGYNVDTVNVTVKFYYQEVDEEGIVNVKERTVTSSTNVVSGAKNATGVIDTTGYDVINLEKASVKINSVSNSSGTISFD